MLSLPDGREVPADATVVARGDQLHIVAGDTWFRLALDDLPT